MVWRWKKNLFNKKSQNVLKLAHLIYKFHLTAAIARAGTRPMPASGRTRFAQFLSAISEFLLISSLSWDAYFSKISRTVFASSSSMSNFFVNGSERYSIGTPPQNFLRFLPPSIAEQTRSIIRSHSKAAKAASSVSIWWPIMRPVRFLPKWQNHGHSFEILRKSEIGKFSADIWPALHVGPRHQLHFFVFFKNSIWFLNYWDIY